MKYVTQAKGADFVDFVVNKHSQDVLKILRGRGNLSREDLEYLVTKVSALKDERLKSCVAELLAWGDDERAELETFVAIAIEVMKRSTPSKLREAARVVELRYLIDHSCNQLHDDVD